jgi:hypothetical protein
MAQSIDGVLVDWGERLFYPGKLVVDPASTPRLDNQLRRQSTVMRRRSQSTIFRRAVQARPRHRPLTRPTAPTCRRGSQMSLRALLV